MSASDIAGRSILVVDDEPVFARTLADGLAVELKGVDIRVAHHGKDALTILQSNAIDLVVTDVNMPVMDGMSLVAEMVSQGITIPVIMVTAFGTREIEIDARRHGVISVIDKPIDFPLVVEICASTLRSRSRGVIEGVTLAGFLQLLQMEQRSCTVRVYRDGARGAISIERGQVISCSAQDESGFDALCAIVSWDSARIEMGPFVASEEHQEAIPLNLALLEGARRADESRRSSRRPDKPMVPPPPKTSSSPRKRPPPPPKQEPRDEGRTTRRIDMSNIQQTMHAGMDIQGAVAIALVDYESGMCLGYKETGGFPIEVAAAGNTEVVRAKLRVMNDIGIEGRIHDILITLENQYHLIAPLTKGSLFLYLALDRKKSNLALARHKLTDLEKALTV